jgi:hypothetical protein
MNRLEKKEQPQEYVLKANTVGSTEEIKLRQSAIKALNFAKNCEIEKIAKGYRWMRKGMKDFKLVHPDKISVEKKNGFVLTKK